MFIRSITSVAMRMNIFNRMKEAGNFSKCFLYILKQSKHTDCKKIPWCMFAITNHRMFNVINIGIWNFNVRISSCVPRHKPSEGIKKKWLFVSGVLWSYRYFLRLIFTCRSVSRCVQTQKIWIFGCINFPSFVEVFWTILLRYS